MPLKIKVVISGLLLLLPLMTSGALDAATPEESFKKHFPQIPLESITPTAINGLYEIVTNGIVAYYAPGPEYLIRGEILTLEGKNLTLERAKAVEEQHAQVMAKRLKEIPLDKALTIGSGPRQVIEITDPDCGFCRKASAFLSKRSDLTRHILFLPLAMHPDAEAKVRYIFCAADRPAAYEEAMTGKLDPMAFKVCDDPSVGALIETHKEIAVRTGVRGTPLFLIDGQIVNGADIPRMEMILDGRK
jgi:thiol:disulfide interchange protein DsbC